MAVPVKWIQHIRAYVNGRMSIESLRKARYYVCFKHYYIIKFGNIFFLEQKNEICGVLEQFLNEAETDVVNK
jgi:hypothetical protein